MAVTLEQVERLREKTNVSYEEAKAILERHNGDLLEALIELERKGKSDTASRGGFYTTQSPGGPETEPMLPPAPIQSGKSKGGAKYAYSYGSAQGHKGGSEADGFGSAIRDIFQRSMVNQVEVWRNGNIMTTIPVLVLVLLLVFFFWITIPLAIVGLFLGCRYRFSGPDLGRESVNKVMDNVSATVEDVKKTVKNEFNKK